MHCCSQLYQLFVPRFDLTCESTRIVTVVSFGQQAVLLLYYLIIAGERIQKPRTDADRSAIEEPAPLTGIAADHVHFFERENEHIEVAKVSRERFSFAADE